MSVVDRGISWQGPTPQHWSVGPMRRFLSPRKDLVGNDWSSTQLLSLTKAGVVRRDPDSGVGKFPASFEGYQFVEPGDLVLCLFDVDETPRTVGVSSEAGMITSAYSRFRVNEAVADASFVEWAFIAIDDFKRFRPLYTGLRKVVQRPRLLGARFALPPVAEQRAIADFLDRETAKIDALIEKQTELINRLRERRTATIGVVATSGLRAGPRKSTTSPYLASVPVHWTVSHFALEMIVNGGQVDPAVAPWSSWPLVAPNHVESGTGRLAGVTPAAEQGADSGKYVVTRGQIIYSKIRPALNKVTIAPERALCSADMYAMSSRKSDDHRYLVYYMLSQPFHSFASEVSARVKMPKINREELGAAPWLRPPLDEQVEIVEYLDRETGKIDELIEKTEWMIALSRERRSALITAAVTGQLEVTNMGDAA